MDMHNNNYVKIREEVFSSFLAISSTEQIVIHLHITRNYRGILYHISFRYLHVCVSCEFKLTVVYYARNGHIIVSQTFTYGWLLLDFKDTHTCRYLKDIEEKIF
jgi:hypothetical protein